MIPQSDPAEPNSGDDLTFHLTPEAVWLNQAEGPFYEPEGFADTGFIHCTHGEAPLLAVANLCYRADPRSFVILVIALARVTVEIRYEDAHRIYPHLHGLLGREAVVAVRGTVRDADGAFVAIDEPDRALVVAAHGA